MSGKMTTDSNESNPYSSPHAPSASDLLDHHRFPWRVIPVVVLYVYGGLLVVLCLTTVYMLLGGCSISVDKNHRASNAQAWGMMLCHILIGVHGCFAIFAGRSLWKRHWRRCFIFFAGAVAVMITVAVTTYVVLRLPPGTELRSSPKTVGVVLPNAPTEYEVQSTESRVFSSPYSVLRTSYSLARPSPHAIIPFVSAINAVSRFNSTSLNSVRGSVMLKHNLRDSSR